ncbi:transglutaminase family protein [Tessaracoccus sp. Z1128]
MRFSYHPWTSVVAAVAVWLGLLPLATMVQGTGYLLEAAVVTAGAGVLGAGLAALRLPRALVLLAQILAVGAYVAWRATALAGAGIMAPVSSIGSLVAEGVLTIRTGAAPVEPTPGLMWLIVALTALLVLVVELLINVLEQPGWAIAPLGLAYGIAAVTLVTDLEFPYLLPVVVGYLAVLLSATGLADEVTGKASRVGAYLLSRTQVAVAAGAVAVVLALLLAPLVPLGEKQPWNTTGLDGPIQLSDPTVRLEQDLKRPQDSRVLTYRTSNDEPAYIRTVALPELSTSGARLLPMRLSRFGLSGAYSFPGERVEVEVTMAGVPSEYLPAPFAVDSIDAAGSWSFDPDTMSVVASGPDRLEQTIDLTYSVVSTMPSPTREDIEAAEAGSTDAVTLAVPEGLDPGVAELTAEVVAGAETSGQKALAIQEFLRSEEFAYSFDAPPSTGTDAISSFLLDERAGYCIHFAAAMITMARTEGIPARMAIGFAPGERLEDGSFEVTAHDAHSWPELYFDGLGWIPFEPTPAYDGPTEYTDPAAQPSESPSASASPSPSASATPSALPPEAPTPTLTPTAPGGFGGTDWTIWLLVGVGVLVLLALPALVRLIQRWWRLRGGDPRVAAGSAWLEVESLFRDFGRPWPDGSPGPVAVAAAEGLGANGAAALKAIAHTVEVSRFSRTAADPGRLPAEVRALRAALVARSTPMVRARAVLLPASLWRRAPAG